MAKKISTLDHLKLLALRCVAYSSTKISELTSAVTETIEELDDQKADKATFACISIPLSAWSTNTETASLSAGFNYYADVAVADVTANDSAETVLDFASLEVAKTCGMSNTSKLATGSIRYYAVEKPTSPISAQVRVIQGQT